MNIIITLLLSSCENDIKEIELLTQKEKTPIQTAKNVETYYSDSASVKFAVFAPQRDIYKDKNLYFEFPKGIHFIQYNNNKKLEIDAKANYAIYYQDEKRIEAKNNVIVKNSKGDQLETEHLVYDEPKDLIYTNEFVKITTKDEVIYGNGLEANRDFTKYTIKNIKGIFQIKN